MLHTEFKAPESSSSEEEDFQVYFISETKTPPPTPQGHFGPKGHHLNKLGTGPLGNATYQKALCLAVSEEMFEAIVDNTQSTMDNNAQSTTDIELRQ